MYNHETKDLSLSNLSPFSAFYEWMFLLVLVSFLSVTRIVGTYRLIKTELKQMLIKTVSKRGNDGLFSKVTAAQV